MICTNCQTDNRADGKFCVRCGAPLLQSPQPAYTQPVPVEPTPASMRPTMPLDETDVPPLLDDYSLQSSPSDAGWDGDVKRLGFPFEPLPEGAMIGQYIVTQVLDGQAGVQRYIVQDEAGTAMYLLKESAEWKALRPEWELIQRGVKGEGLRPPLYAFQQRTGAMRYYLLLSPIGSIIGSLSVPIEVPKAINYGVSLARGLAVLHAQQIGIGKMDAQHIAIEGDEAYFCDFGSSIVLENPSQYDEEVRKLAIMLYKLLTGQREYSPQNSLSPAYQPLFDQLLGQKQSLTAEALAQELTRLSGQMRRPKSIDLRVGRLTDVGMVRQLNEDSLCTMELVWNNQSKNIPVGVYVVADGMGGHEGGEIASGLTIKAITQLAAEKLLVPTTRGEAPDYDAWLVEAVEAANTAVYNRSQQSRNDMGTTVVIALVIGDEVHIAHVGDSRAYHVSEQIIEQITTDHSLVERLIATGQITKEEAQHHPQSNVIYRTIGDKPKIEVDISYAHIGAGESLLLCSDGLSGMVSNERIQQIVTQAVSPQVACTDLIAAANVAGGDDNISVIIIKPEALA